MCGICGVLGPIQGGTGEREALTREMMTKLAHRGPDGEGLWSGGEAALGHRRLAIIDLELGAQPMLSADGRHVLIFNGEIYNYVELRQRLVQRGVRFRTFSDTEVLLQLLIADGERALSQLNGMFAFLFLDTVNGEWLMARDPFGVKPLYYAHTRSGGLVFASEIKALLNHPGLQATVDPAGLNQYLTFQFCLGSRTLFGEVEKLEPGCWLKGRWGESGDHGRYWDVEFGIDEYHTEEYFRDRLRGLLEESARLQVRSDVPLGAYLSGGMDSSVVAALAGRTLDGGLPLFTGKFLEGPAYDESHYARLVADAISGELHEITPTATDFTDLLPSLIHALDEPVAGPGLFPQYLVSRLAARHVKVVLGGQGGDEVFGGYARYLVAYLEQALKGAIFETQEEGRHVVTLESIVPNLPLLKQYGPLMGHFWRDGLFEEMDRRYFRMIDRSPDLERLLTPEALAGVDRERVFADFQAQFNHPDTRSYINKMTHFDFKTLLPALLQVEDRVSMAASLEARVPLLDTRIVELVASVPPRLKFQGGRTKALLKDAAAHLVPEPVMARKDKMGFPVPLKEWMAGGPVRDFVADTLLSSRSLQRGLFRPEALQDLIGSGGVFGRQLWGVLCLELWHRQFIDGEIR